MNGGMSYKGVCVILINLIGMWYNCGLRGEDRTDGVSG